MSDWNKHYHWKTKGVTPWAKEYFSQRIIGQETSKDGAEVRIDSLDSWEGDVELGNRKGKLITIYDCSMTFKWSGKTADGTEANGTLIFPEVSHDVHDDGDEYRFDLDLASSANSASSTLLSLLRKDLTPKLLPAFHSFRNDLVATHAKDLGHDDAAAKAVKDGGKDVGMGASGSVNGAAEKKVEKVLSDEEKRDIEERQKKEAEEQSKARAKAKARAAKAKAKRDAADSAAQSGGIGFVLPAVVFAGAAAAGAYLWAARS